EPRLPLHGDGELGLAPAGLRGGRLPEELRGGDGRHAGEGGSRGGRGVGEGRPRGRDERTLLEGAGEGGGGAGDRGDGGGGAEGGAGCGSGRKWTRGTWCWGTGRSRGRRC